MIWFGSVAGETWFERDADETVYACSLIKVPIAVAAEALDLDREVEVHPPYPMLESDDQDPATWAEVGRTQTLRELRRRMLVDSGNLASALVLEATGPVPEVRRGIGAPGPGTEVSARQVGRWMSAVPPAVEAVLREQRYRDGIPAALPGVPCANKTGWVDGLTHDAAILRPAAGPPGVLVVLTRTDGYAEVRAGAAEAWAHRP